MRAVGRFVRVSVVVAGLAVLSIAAPLGAGATAGQNEVSVAPVAHSSVNVVVLRTNGAALEAALRARAAALRAALGG